MILPSLQFHYRPNASHSFPQFLLSNRTRENLALNSSSELSGLFLWRADTQSGFNGYGRGTQSASTLLDKAPECSSADTQKGECGHILDGSSAKCHSF